MSSLLTRSFCPLLISLMICGPLHADVKLPEIFGDHMVLQRETSVPVWGWADPGETVTVTAATDKASAVAGQDGQWSLKLEKLAASATPVELTISGKNSITLHDVLVGDVWVCSGQSNMEYGIRAFIAKEELAQANEPEIRLFAVPKCVAPVRAGHIAPAPVDAPLLGKWQVCTPDTICKDGEWSGFSGVGYYFGHEIHAYTHQPVGLIGTYWGGTRIHSWTSLQGLKTNPDEVSSVKAATNFADNYDQIKHNYEDVLLPQWKLTIDKWNQENKDAIEAYKSASADWQQQVKAAQADHKPLPPRPVAPKPPKEPRDPIHDNASSTALFNGMVAPIIPYAIKGVVWYQGEANAAEPDRYERAFPILIQDWRTQWGQGDFPFLFVQLPNFMPRKPQTSDSTWVRTREAQAHALSLPKTGMAVTIDIGEPGNIHPADKFDVGQRLARAAMHVAYDDPQAIYSGPTFKSLTIEGNKARIQFDNIGTGLTIATAPPHFFASEKKPAPSSPATQLQGFAIAGADNKFVWATASIEGDSVVVTSDAVPNPAVVRYAWADDPDCNLYNKQGLPAAPFRTDALPLGK